MDPSAFLYDVPPAVVESFCKIMDGGGDRFGWRGLAVRVVPSLLEVRMLERTEAAGRSPTRELLWTWAQQNPRVRDLREVLQDMGHHRALGLFQGQESPSPPGHQHAESAGQMPAAEVQALSPMYQPPTVTFRDVLEGTRDFHPDMRIAAGHFSDVYRAQIGNETYAVKLFKQINKASWKKVWDIFRKEMEVHHLYQHPNILELLCCFSDEGRYCLVHPYLPNGSLFRRLHRQNGEPPLSWKERLTIIKGTAKALHHLHTAQPCPVICGNISSANILLDDALQPKLSDFGLARLRPHSASQHCTITLDASSHSNLGYLPEEYIRDGKLSFSLDVYSFGMVIMETLTGRKVVKDTPKQTQLALLALSKLLPPPSCPPADQPRSLDDGALVNPQQGPSASIPVEHDEQQSPPCSPARAGPRECSQSEVTYLSDVGAHGEAAADLYSSWPVQCGCAAERGGLACEDCRANGFTPNHSGSPQVSGDLSVVENAAKQRLRNKLSLYDRGLIHTEELLSEAGLQ
ncbi:interleukin-1 receptor-associated kinase 3 isoform X2 [Enoplosus armatus]|uniref:interleukin-1 receptor-associated kinase 3 isoform X2 n=1 Tax=Enoplosus armatus TaxID=215367 RepID=UPI003995510E